MVRERGQCPARDFEAPRQGRRAQVGMARRASEIKTIAAPHLRDRERDEDVGDLKVGKADNAFLFPGECSGFIDPDRFDAEIWKPITTKAGMAGTRFRDLRHFFASQLIANNETAAFVRDQMGHSSIKVTLDTYGRLFPGRGKEASERYEKAMETARKKSEADVSKVLAIDGGPDGKGTVTN